MRRTGRTIPRRALRTAVGVAQGRRTWRGPELEDGLWVSLAADTREVTPRQHARFKASGRPVKIRFTGPLAFDTVLVGRRPDASTPDDVLREDTALEATPGFDMQLDIQWDGR